MLDPIFICNVLEGMQSVFGLQSTSVLSHGTFAVLLMVVVHDSFADRDADSCLQVTTPNDCAIKACTRDSKPVNVKPDKMEETLTCIICQELLHDCVRYGPLEVTLGAKLTLYDGSSAC